MRVQMKRMSLWIRRTATPVCGTSTYIEPGLKSAMGGVSYWMGRAREEAMGVDGAVDYGLM